MSWSHEQVEHLIDNYQRWPCLYVTKSLQYKNKHARTCAIEAIEASLKTVRPLTNSHEIKTKIQGLRTNFFNEHKKVQASKCSGTGEETVYHPTLWYYEKLLFLLEHNVARKAVDSIEDNAESSIEDSIEIEQYNDEESNIHYIITDIQDDHTYTTNTPSTSYQTESRPTSANSTTSTSSFTPQKRKKKMTTDSADKVLEQASGSLNAISNVFTALQDPNVSVSKGSDDIFGEFVVSKMKLIKDAELKRRLENEIINLLYNTLQKDN